MLVTATRGDFAADDMSAGFGPNRDKLKYISSSAPPSRGGDNIKVQNHLILVFNGPEKSTVGFIAEAALQQAE